MSSDKFDDVRSLLDINEGDLNGEFARLPSHTARWAYLAADAVNEVAKAKHHYDKLFAQVREDTRIDGLSQSVPLKYTVDQLDGKVTNTLVVVLARDAVAEAELRKSRILGVCEGLRAKRDMLIQLGASQRAAREVDLWMKQSRTPRPSYDPGPQWPHNPETFAPTNPSDTKR